MSQNKIQRLQLNRLRILIVLVVLAGPLNAQERFFFGALGGASTLSSDALATIQPPQLESSSYKASNGPTLSPVFGVHLSDYFSLQAEYFWNRNNLELSSLSPAAFYSQKRTSSQHTALGELMLYFRKRSSWVRPYLTVGAGVVHLSSKAEGAPVAGGPAALPPERFSSNNALLHVAVGIDLRIRNGWAFRYSFAEAISGNGISKQLSPPAAGNLKNFRNLFGFVKYF